MLRSPRRQRSTISALNSGVNEQQGRGFLFSMVSILDILSGGVPLMVDTPSNTILASLPIEEGYRPEAVIHTPTCR